jgi:cell wall-associated NlpC family hydrolase
VEQQIIDNARQWLGTPWKHNQQALGLGVDCIQLAIATFAALDIYTGEIVNYYRVPKGNSLLDYLDSLPNTNRIEKIQPGTILLFKVGGIPHHVAIATSETTMIHACQRAGKVVEHSIGAWERKLVAVFEVVGSGCVS